MSMKYAVVPASLPSPPISYMRGNLGQRGVRNFHALTGNRVLGGDGRDNLTLTTPTRHARKADLVEPTRLRVKRCAAELMLVRASFPSKWASIMGQNLGEIA